MTPEDIEVEYWAHQYFFKPESVDEFEDDDFDTDAVMKAFEEDVWGDFEE